ncbi:T9SS type A sorting domain-containing protein [Bacteroidota bacterium]
MKFALCLVFFFSSFSYLFGEISAPSSYINDTKPYSFEKIIEEYIPLSNPIDLTNSEIWDENQHYLIDFNFRIYDQSYSTVTVNAGGGISFPDQTGRWLRVYHTVFGGFLLKSKSAGSSESSICYEISGMEGDRILKIQWENAGFVQWYDTSDTEDFVDFQIWLFESDYHIEIHFGSNSTDSGTYGYPNYTSNPDPGPGVNFNYNDCYSFLCLYGAADNPSYDFYNFCTPNQIFIDGTPSEGTTYVFTLTNNSSILENEEPSTTYLYPNPLTSELYIDNDQIIKQIRIFDMNGRIKYLNKNIDKTNTKLELNHLNSEIYFIEILDIKKQRIYKLIKISGH